MSDVSCVLAIRNEEHYLQYSLQNLLAIPFKEIVVVLDRCTDGSRMLVQQYSDYRFKIVEKTCLTWRNPNAEAKNMGVRVARGNLIFHTDADVILDVEAVHKAIQILQYRRDVDAVVVGYKLHSLYGSIFDRLRDEWLNIFARLVRLLRLQPSRGGIYLARKKYASPPDCDSAYDAVQRGGGVVYVESRTLHLRPRYERESQESRGRSRAFLPQYSLAKMLLAILQLQPYMLTAYMQTKRRLKN